MKKVKNKRLLAAFVATAMAMTAVPIGLTVLAAEPEDTTVSQLGSKCVTDWDGNGIHVICPMGNLFIASDNGGVTPIAQDVKSYEEVEIAYLGNEIYQSQHYIGSSIYTGDRIRIGNFSKYLIQDHQNTLWDWGWNSETQQVEKKQIAENVVTYTPSVALLENGDVIDTLGAAMYPQSNYVKLENVKEISNNTHLSPYTIYALQQDGNLQRWNMGQLARSTAEEISEFFSIDTGVSTLIDNVAYIKDGSTYSLESQSKLAEFPAVQAVYAGNYYLVDANNVLYEAVPGNESVTELTNDFDRFYVVNGYVTGYVTNAGEAYDLNGEAMDLPFPANEIKKQSDNFVLKTDGTLWIVRDSGTEQLLENVADISGWYAVRTDCSVWEYDGNQKFDEIVSSDGASTDPTIEPTTDADIPTEDENTTVEQESSDVGNSDATNNPSTGDSLTALSTGAAAAAAAGVLLITRKKVR